MNKVTLIGVCMVYACIVSVFPNAKTITVWSVGNADNSSEEFALAPNGFKKFIENDFGYEDKFFLIGYSHETYMTASAHQR